MKRKGKFVKIVSVVLMLLIVLTFMANGKARVTRYRQ